MVETVCHKEVLVLVLVMTVALVATQGMDLLETALGVVVEVAVFKVVRLTGVDLLSNPSGMTIIIRGVAVGSTFTVVEEVDHVGDQGGEEDITTIGEVVDVAVVVVVIGAIVTVDTAIVVSRFLWMIMLAVGRRVIQVVAVVVRVIALVLLRIAPNLGLRRLALHLVGVFLHVMTAAGVPSPAAAPVQRPLRPHVVGAGVALIRDLDHDPHHPSQKNVFLGPA